MESKDSYVQSAERTLTWPCVCLMVVGNVVAASTDADCVDKKGYIVWDRCEGPEVAAADRSVRSYFEDM